MRAGRKRLALLFNLLLLAWFTLDMTGMRLGGAVLVARSWREDGIFWLVFAVCLLWFWRREKSGRWGLAAWLTCWLATQFFSHWYVSLVGPWEGKNRYFAGTVKLFTAGEVYLPDLYHVVLHLLIGAALAATLCCCFDRGYKRQ